MTRFRTLDRLVCGLGDRKIIRSVVSLALGVFHLVPTLLIEGTSR